MSVYTGNTSKPLTSIIAISATLLFSTPLQANPTHYQSRTPSVTAIDSQSEPVGGFGRLFPLYTGKESEKNTSVTENGVVHRLLEHPSHRIQLLRLADGMIEEGAGVQGEMPLAHVFLGQFIDHDITLDTATNFDSLAVNIANSRTPDLDLDCVYGQGREASPFLYAGPYLRVGAITVDSGDRLFNRYDLLRVPSPADELSGVSPENPANVNTVAVIGDPRNDENFAVSQVQAAFIAYHNRMVDRIIEKEISKRSELSQQLSEPLAKTQELIDSGNTIDDILDQVAKLDEFSYSQQLSKRSDSDFLNKQSQRVQSVQLFAAQSKDAATDTSIVELNALLDFAANQNQQDLANLRGELLGEHEFVEYAFEEARDLTIHHYHRVIMEDFLPRIISGDRVLDMMAKGRNFYFPSGFQPGGSTPFIPIEFSVAAYRFAHSQVPGRFPIREGVNSALFRGAKGNEPSDLTPRGFSPIRTSTTNSGQSVPISLLIDWSELLDVSDDAHAKALKIDTFLSSPLETLDIPGVTPQGGLSNLAARNLSRGRTYRLPSGQDLARVIIRKLEAQDSLGAYSFDAGAEGKYILDADKATTDNLITSETPLWYYIIQEASCFIADGTGDQVPMKLKLASKMDETTGICEDGGNVLGPVGGTIVGEVLWGLIDHYRVHTGSGIDLNVSFDYCTEGEDNCSLNARNKQQIMTGLSETLVGNSRRYMLKNLLHDAGVAYLLDESVTVCSGAAYLPEEECVITQ